MSARLTPLRDLEVLRHHIPAYGLTPNTSIQNKPLMIYRSAFQADISASHIEAHFESVGVVVPQWRYTMYSTSHFHSTTHEVLGISAGRARLCFGHEDNPSNITTMVQRGDVVVVPAGVAHRLLEDLSAEEEGFEMVGAYPTGCSWDMCYGKKGEERKVEAIAKLDWFDRDPVYGREGPVLGT